MEYERDCKLVTGPGIGKLEYVGICKVWGPGRQSSLTKIIENLEIIRHSL